MKISQIHLTAPNPQLKYFTTIDSKNHTIEFNEEIGIFIIDKKIGIPSSNVMWFIFESEEKEFKFTRKLRQTKESTDAN